MRKGDTSVVTLLDRLARSSRDLYNIVHVIEKKGGRPARLREEHRYPDEEGHLFFAMLNAFS